MSINPAVSNTSAYTVHTSSATVVDNKRFGMALDKEGTSHNNELLERMDVLLQDVEEMKERIQEDLTVDNIMEYKDTIQSFLNFYVDNIVGYQEITLRHPKYGYSQKMTVVRKIEEGMSELDDVMSFIDTKTGHLDMLNKIGEINGMILDLVL